MLEKSYNLSEPSEFKDYEREALLFNAAVRALGTYGYSNITFDIGGKKSRRRYVSTIAPDGQTLVIWIKSATNRWQRTVDAVRFPWKKAATKRDGPSAVATACCDAARRGATHFLAVAGDYQTGRLSFARVYKIDEIPKLAAMQAEHIEHTVFDKFGAALILQTQTAEFTPAAQAACTVGQDILSPPPHTDTSTATHTVHHALARALYRRDQKVRSEILRRAGGRCECCGELGFLMKNGERYLETHHVVGVAERGPDASGNIVAACPMCHRKAHYAADRVQIELKMLEAIRRRGRPPGIDANGVQL